MRVMRVRFHWRSYLHSGKTTLAFPCGFRGVSGPVGSTGHVQWFARHGTQDWQQGPVLQTKPTRSSALVKSVALW